MLTERSKVPLEPKKRDFFPAKNPVDARREVVIAMPLDPAIGFAMVGFFFEDWLPHNYYSYACIWLLSAYLFICLSRREKNHKKTEKETEDAILKKWF